LTSVQASRTLICVTEENPTQGNVTLTDAKVVLLDTAIGNNLNFLRTREKWSQAELARRLAERSGEPWNQQLVSLAERGRRPFRVLDLLAIADTFEVSTLGLLAEGGVWIDAGNMRIAPDALIRDWIIGRRSEKFTEAELISRWPETLTPKEDANGHD